MHENYRHRTPINEIKFHKKMASNMNDLVLKIPDGTPVYIMSEGNYLSISGMHQITFKDEKEEAEEFRLIKKGKNKFALYTKGGKYLTAFRDRMRDNGTEPLRQQTFKVEGSTLKEVRLFSSFLGYYLAYNEDHDLAFCTELARDAIICSIVNVF